VRIKKSQTNFLKQLIQDYLPGSAVYLIGSRANDSLKGGDIDVLVVGARQLTGQEKRNVKIAFYKEFGEQKIDLVSFKRDEQSSFKDYALLDSVEL